MCHVEHKTLFCSAFLLLRGFSCLPSYPVTSRQRWQLTLDPHTAENHLWRANETAINEPIRTSISIYTQEFRGRVWSNPGHPIIFLLFSTLSFLRLQTRSIPLLCTHRGDAVTLNRALFVWERWALTASLPLARRAWVTGSFMLQIKLIKI